MTALTPQQIADLWAERAAASVAKMKATINAMRSEDNPLEKAAAKQDEWAAGCARAARENKFADGLRSVKFDDWKKAMLGKGVANYQNGLADGKQKFVRFLQAWMPAVERAVDALGPRGTVAQNKGRMDQMFEALSLLCYDKRTNTVEAR